jgi:CubicO group peptidase (beta-lactamase class C family)
MMLHLTLLLLFACTALTHAEDAAAWQARLEALAKLSDSLGGQALLVKRDGKIFWESYANGGGREVAQKIYSGTKAFWGLAALAAAEKGILKLDEPASSTLTEWEADQQKSRILTRQLMDFTSGLPAMPELHANEYPNRTSAAMKARAGYAPGVKFIYGPASLQVFHELLRRKLDGKATIRFLEREVLSPLSLSSQRYLPDAHGTPLLASGFLLTARQWAGMGRVLLEKGEPVLDEDDDLFAEVLRGSKANPAYAFGIWNNLAAAKKEARELDVETMLDRKLAAQSWKNLCLSKTAPPDLLACIGSYGQRLYAVPSQRLLIVRLGKGGQFRDAPFLKKLFTVP